MDLSVKNVVPHAGTWIEITYESPLIGPLTVVPHAGTWIEIWYYCRKRMRQGVVPHAGTWIEMRISTQSWKNTMSFPTREGGLKFSVALVTSVSGVGRSPRGNVG